MSSPDLAKNFPRQGIKATQRDAERYSILREGLRAYPASIVETPPKEDDGAANDDATALVDDDAASTLSSASTVQERKEIVEPASWSQVAYTSLLWWASAGDTRAGLSEAEQSEREMDLSLLDSGDDEDGRTKEIVVVGYFRRLSGMVFDATGTIVRGQTTTNGYRDETDETGTGQEDEIEDDEQEQTQTDDDQQRLLPQRQGSEADPSSDEPPLLEISSEDMSAMSLDMWSSSDKNFIHDFLHVWWGRKARIRGMGVECCGVKIM